MYVFLPYYIQWKTLSENFSLSEKLYDENKRRKSFPKLYYSVSCNGIGCFSSILKQNVYYIAYKHATDTDDNRLLTELCAFSVLVYCYRRTVEMVTGYHCVYTFETRFTKACVQKVHFGRRCLATCNWFE